MSQSWPLLIHFYLRVCLQSLNFRGTFISHASFLVLARLASEPSLDLRGTPWTLRWGSVPWQTQRCSNEYPCTQKSCQAWLAHCSSARSTKIGVGLGHAPVKTAWWKANYHVYAGLGRQRLGKAPDYCRSSILSRIRWLDCPDSHWFLLESLV